MTTPIEKLKQLAESEHVAKDCYFGYSIGKLTSDEAVMLYMHRKTKEHKGVCNRLLREKRA
ncbi:hypothetical protein [Pantoea dispersa]|uniref:hypothetical protein n=1 Tax=Pantoea dispersa TaxID=59814 RepID=UPI00301979AF